MKNLQRLLIAILIATFAMPAAAQFKIGPRAGINANALRFKHTMFDAENRVGFTGGLQIEMMFPITHLGFDVSVMYTHREKQFPTDERGNYDISGKDFIEVPINFKWKIPIVEDVFTPFLFTGPSFAFLLGTRFVDDYMHHRPSDVAWNVGFGLELISHLQISASYGFGMTQTYGGHYQDYTNAKNRYWTTTVAWLF